MEELKALVSDGGRTLTLGTCICILVYVGADRFVSEIEGQIDRNTEAVRQHDLAARDYEAFKQRVSADISRIEQAHSAHAAGPPHSGVQSTLAVIASRVKALERIQDSK